MTQLTDLDLFTGEINIDTTSGGTIAELNAYCLTEEDIAMLELLGNDLYNEYIADAGAGTKWTELINGIAAPYTWNGKSIKYTGLIDKFVYRIYPIYIRDQVAANTPMGDVSPKPSNGEQMYNAKRAANSYNRWIRAFNDAIDFILYKNSVIADTYEEFNTSKITDLVNSWGI